MIKRCRHDCYHAFSRLQVTPMPNPAWTVACSTIPSPEFPFCSDYRSTLPLNRYARATTCACAGVWNVAGRLPHTAFTRRTVLVPRGGRMRCGRCAVTPTPERLPACVYTRAPRLHTTHSRTRLFSATFSTLLLYYRTVGGWFHWPFTRFPVTHTHRLRCTHHTRTYLPAPVTPHLVTCPPHLISTLAGR